MCLHSMTMIWVRHMSPATRFTLSQCLLSNNIRGGYHPIAGRRSATCFVMMLAWEIIQPLISSWTSPIVIVWKKDRLTRFCVDYRKLNAVTQRNAYPLPRIDDTLGTISGSQWFLMLDLLSGYWQVKKAEQDRPKTAFATHNGLFEIKVMLFGLCNAPATFQG